MKTRARSAPRRIDWSRGAACGIGSAALFGASAPLSKRLLPSIGPVMLAGLLYIGAGTGLAAVSLVTRRGWPRLKPSDQVRLAIIAFLGGFLGPSLLMIGLLSVSGVVGSLLLNLEAVFTIALAVLFFGDRLKASEWFGGALVVAGAAILSYQPGAFSAQWPGVLAIVGACLSWGLDNNLTQRISANDPVMIVQIKALAAGSANVLLAAALGQTTVRGHALVAALIVGFACYGISIVLDVYALRYLGAAREAVFFTTAPFLGAIAAVPILGEHFDRLQALAAVLMAVGVLAFTFPRRAS